MIIEQHYDEEVLAEFLGEPRDAVTRDKHLATCDLCQRTLDSLRGTARTLTEPAVWDKVPLSAAPRPETLAFLRGMQKAMADEDTLAAVWIKQLLSGPRETWASRLADHPEWRTGGMVRRLLDASETTVSTVPEDALTMAALAVQISSIEEQAGGAMRRLAGLSYYNRGYAFWYTGKVMEALDDFDHADTILSLCVGADLDHARVWLMRAMAYQMVERLDDALALANQAYHVFVQYGDRDRVAAARSIVGVTLQEAHRHHEALAIHSEVANMEDISDRWRVSALNNLGRCYQAVGDFNRATESLLEAIAGFERLGMLTFRSKSRWNLADVFVQQGKHAQALTLYLELRGEFEELGMANDVALASLDAAEVLLALGRAVEIRDICREAIDYFVANGLAQTEPALRGLAYLQEAAIAGRATRKAISDVRSFLLAPTSEASLLFAEPLQ
jgi:tetratricopeptide (TPR) repeat protein